MIANTTAENWPVGKELLPHFKADMNLSFDTVSDTMPGDRLKLTH